MAPPRICFDRPLPTQHKIEAARLATSENKFNEPPPLVLPPGASFHPLKMAIVTGKRWENGRKLGVRFLDGSAKQRALAQKYATLWSKYANVIFDFNAGASAEIRISFVADPGSWSAVGTDCLVRDAFPLAEATMNFGWLRDGTDEEEWRRVVTHEFGHALGAIHEHQNPKGSSIKWNLPAVYKTFSGPPNNWTKEEIDFNIVQKYSIDQLNATKFDVKSIMLYAFPANLIIGGHATPNNTQISSGDKKFIGQMYPKVAVQAGAPGPKLSLKKAAEVAAASAKPRTHPALSRAAL
jgi:hypothetical protein